MRHFPIYLDLDNKIVVLSGAGAVAVAKLRLLLKTGARIFVYGRVADKQVQDWARAGRLTLTARRVQADDLQNATLFYCANDNDAEDSRALKLAQAAGIMTNLVDNLQHSDFITPALVDRAPLTVAIGTEGAAPVLARQIKKQLEAALPAELGIVTRIAQGFRNIAANLPEGRPRRAFWSAFYSGAGVAAHRAGGAAGVRELLRRLYRQTLDAPTPQGAIWIIGTGGGQTELLTQKAHAILHNAEVVIYDALVGKEFLELARREASIIPAGRGKVAMPSEITQVAIDSVKIGGQVVRLVSGDASDFSWQNESSVGLNHKALKHAGLSAELIPNVPITPEIEVTPQATEPRTPPKNPITPLPRAKKSTPAHTEQETH